MSKYKLAIFDLDGTILDTLEDLKDSANYVLVQKGYAEKSLSEIRSYVGNGIRRLIERCLPENTEEAVATELFEAFTVCYKEHCMDKTKPYDGVLDMLFNLRETGFKTAVLSNKADYAVQILCDKFFPGMFDTAAGMKDSVRRKPYPDGIFNVLKELDIQPADAVYIGDSEVDILTAKNASIDCIAVDWGFRDREVLLSNGAETVASTMDELLYLLER